ncbi:MAG: 23S rRNA (adenine(1618)-N(6))-methyltransferase RlmF [Reichenbachiella sp.]
MSTHKKKKDKKERPRLHPRNKHQGRYDLKELYEGTPALKEFIQKNIHGSETIDFSNPDAVKSLNQAILKTQYGINHWDIPTNYLVPPIPSRADYIHHMADLLCNHNYGVIPRNEKITCLDIGIGANCIYPIIGAHEYGWNFIGADIDPIAIDSCKNIISKNSQLIEKIELRTQTDIKDIIYGILRKEDKVDLTICNPPFHASAEDAQTGSLRKVNNLSENKTTTAALNFGGQSHELWCEGGEKKFIRDLIRQSKKFSNSAYWFSTLVSKASNVKGIEQSLKEAQAVEVQVIPMGQGNKTSRIVAWTFLSKGDQKEWKDSRWKDKKAKSA